MSEILKSGLDLKRAPNWKILESRDMSKVIN